MHDDLPYRRLALHVLSLAVKDAARPLARTAPLGRSTPSYYHHTALRFLSDVTNARLALWCAWLDLDPASLVDALRGTYDPPR